MMKQERLQIGSKVCNVYSAEQPTALLVQPMGRQEVSGMNQEVELIAKESGKPFAMAAFDILDWDRQLTPWPDSEVSKNPEAGRHAIETLAYIEQQLLPFLQTRFGRLPCILGGYSLGGLFSLWAACESDSFTGVAASSPSVWINGWLQYAQEHPMRAKQVYMSLGDKEEFSRNKSIAQVGNNIREYHKMLVSQLGESHTTLAWNTGNHFQDGIARTARGFTWNLKL
jgi:hypothetical protein